MSTIFVTNFCTCLCTLYMNSVLWPK
uniref:Uncharacterized protein n=1 Tax=Arundo donax TaxID=35708 RepID=A0A0A8Y655_ARUDO